MDHPSNDDATVLFIEGQLNIYRAHELKQLLVDRLADAGRLDLDLAGVSEIDSAGLQVLLLAKRIAMAARQQLHVIAPSPAVQELFKLTGLAAHFDIASDDPLPMGAAAQS